jgi:flagellin
LIIRSRALSRDPRNLTFAPPEWTRLGQHDRGRGTSCSRMAKIGSNILAQIIQRNLGRHSADLHEVYQRLSSGNRINRPADDPAGDSLASSLNLQRRIANERLRSLNDVINLTSLAERAVDSLSQVISRLRELSLQASTLGYTVAQRAAINTEAQALAAEYNRITRSTTWNDRQLFDRTLGALSLSTSDDGASASELRSTLGGAIGTGLLGTQISYGSGAPK